MASTWAQLLFETLEAGVSSALAPELLPPNQASWGMNIDVRGGKPSTRPNMVQRMTLPPGLVQGGEYFGVQGGMLVISVAGLLYKIRINSNNFACESINLSFDNSPIIKQVWMTQTVETLVIQDGQSNAILYNGSSTRRAVTGEVPRGKQMAYGNGRLWVTVDANNVVAGDIRTNAAGSELLFTESTYLTGGGKLYFPSPTTGMSFIPVTGQSDYGVLLVFGARETNAIRADITSRDDWGRMPGFVTALLRSVGSSGQWPIVSVNQDLYWRDSNGGIRSIRNALADEAGPGSAPISREVSRLTDYDSQQLLPFCSGVYFDNRMLMTSSPYLLPNGGVGWKNIIPLDFAPLSSMGGKSQPAYDGKWNGLNFVKLMGGEFRGKNRAFAIVTTDEGVNELWEFGTGDRADAILLCEEDEVQRVEEPITCFIEYPRRNFGDSKHRKLLTRCDVWLSSVDGEVDLSVYWRSDNSQKWLKWDEATTCATTSDPSTSTPHVWKNLLTQERPQFKTFTIPDTINQLVGYAADNGFEFQVRLVWSGRCRIHRMMLMAKMQDDPDYADRTGFDVACVENDVSGNNVEYVLPGGNCPPFILYFDITTRVRSRSRLSVGTGGSGPRVFTFPNTSGFHLRHLRVIIIGCEGAFTVTGQPAADIAPGDTGTFTITWNSAIPCPGGALVVIENGNFEFTLDESATVIPEITVQPESVCAEDGESASFSLTAVHGPLEYDWFVSIDGGMVWTELVDGGIYSGVNTSSLTIDPVATDMNTYLYRCRVRNPDGNVISDEVTLTVGNCSAAGCALFVPSQLESGGLFGSYIAAFNLLAARSNNCIGYGVSSNNSALASFDVNNDTPNQLVLQGTAPDLDNVSMYASLTIPDATVMTFAFTLDNAETTGATVVIKDIDGNTVYNHSGSVSPFVAPSLDAGTYTIEVLATGPGLVGPAAGTFTITTSTSFVVNPVIGLWDDSGTTRQLEACPKMHLPPLIESTGLFYADCAEAAAIITERVASCLFYSLLYGTHYTNSAVGGLGNITLGTTNDIPDGDVTGVAGWISINGTKDEVVTMDWSVSGGVGLDCGGLISVYDYAGNFLFSASDIGGASGTAVTAALPYTGKFLISFDVSDEESPGPTLITSASAVISSPGLSANPMQALYQSGLSCPARLDCGDSCP